MLLNVYDYLAQGDSVHHLAQEARLRGSTLYFPAGDYLIESTLDLTGCSIRGDGPYRSRIICTAADQAAVILCGSHLSIRDVGIGFDECRENPACACVFVKNLGTDGRRGLYRSVIENVRLFKGYHGVYCEEGNRAVMFSNTWNTVAIEEFRGWGYHNRSEGTGSVFNNLYGIRSPVGDTTLRCQGLLRSCENEIVLNQVNCEWALIEETGIELTGGENAVINSCHFEGVRFEKPNRSLITTSRPVLTIHGLTIDDWHVEASARPCSIVRVAGRRECVTRIHGCVVKDSHFPDKPRQVFAAQLLQDSTGLVVFRDLFDLHDPPLLQQVATPSTARSRCTIE